MCKFLQRGQLSHSAERERVLVKATRERNGAGTRIRTVDLLITSQLLYQLSYAGNVARILPKSI